MLSTANTGRKMASNGHGMSSEPRPVTACSNIPHTNTPAIAPQAPSRVLPGLMAGASLTRPKARPVKYAALSATHTSAMTASSSQASTARSSTSASAVGTITSQPVSSPAAGATCQPRASHGGTTNPQNASPAPCTTTEAADVPTPEPSTAHSSAVATTNAGRSAPATRTRPHHSQAARPATSAISAIHNDSGAKNSAARKPAIRMTAVTTRSLSIAATLLRRHARDLLAGAAETALARAVGRDCLIERELVEVGPQRVGEVQLGVGELPQQEVADALLATGPDEEVRLRRIGHRQLGADLGLGEVAAARVARGEAVERRDDVPASAVVGGHGQHQAVVAGRQRLGLLDEPDDRRIEARQVADDTETHAVLVQAPHLVLQRAHEQLHQERDFLGRTAPVLGTEGEQGQVVDAAFHARADHRAHGLDAATVARDARQV